MATSFRLHHRCLLSPCSINYLTQWKSLSAFPPSPLPVVTPGFIQIGLSPWRCLNYKALKSKLPDHAPIQLTPQTHYITRMANDGTSRELTRRNVHTSIDIEGIVTSMREKLDDLPLLSHGRCIYEVPSKLRKINEEAYNPLRASIGPHHHGKKALKPMEEHKWRYLQGFLQRSRKGLEELVKFMEDREERIRQCYAETVCFSSNKFVEIVLVDAAFIIEVLLKWQFPKLRTTNDCLFGPPWIIFDIICDLRLLENQLPFFVLEDLYQVADIKLDSNQGNNPTFIDLTRKYFEDTMKLEDIPENIDSSQVKHFVDFIRSCLKPRERSQQTERKGEVEFIRSATELHEAGVEFKVGSSKNLLDIKFSGGVLEIPRIEINDETESLLRNLVAFEQCHYVVRYITDYVAVMDSLINTSKDVQLLIESRVIENWLGDNEDVSNLFNQLGKEITMNLDELCFYELYTELNNYCKIPWNKWKATLRHDYFSTPWQVLSIVVAAILLILTFIQTVCSIVK